MKTRFHHFKEYGTIASRMVDGHIECGVARLAEGDRFNRKLGRTIAEGRMNNGSARNYHVTDLATYVTWIKAMRHYEASEAMQDSVAFLLAMGPNEYQG